jgi:hypothetical protein
LNIFQCASCAWVGPARDMKSGPEFGTCPTCGGYYFNQSSPAAAQVEDWRDVPVTAGMLFYASIEGANAVGATSYFAGIVERLAREKVGG